MKVRKGIDGALWRTPRRAVAAFMPPSVPTLHDESCATINCEAQWSPESSEYLTVTSVVVLAISYKRTFDATVIDRSQGTPLCRRGSVLKRLC
jgi:hypothetical protein